MFQLGGEQLLKNLDFPVAVMSFNRPELLARVLQDIKFQTIAPRGENVHLFQDGPFPDTAEQRYLVNKCIEIFEREFPEGTAHISDKNIGVAFNFDLAERLFFETNLFDFGLFFEDDLILSPNYIRALLRLTEFALSEPLVAYVAAYGNHLADHGSQERRSTTIIPLQHKWGFALTRRQWLSQRPIVDPYLEILRGYNYRNRPASRILEYFRSLGYQISTATSQDACKDIASLVLGTEKLNCFPCFGKYVGETGLHFNSELYNKLGYGKTILYEGDIPEFNFPSKDTLEQWVLERRKSYAI